jgi:hypothetical protein
MTTNDKEQPMLLPGIRFLLEIVGLAGAAWAAFALAGGGALGLVAAAIAVAVFALAWGTIAAPKARNDLSPRARQVAGSAILLAVAGAITWAGQPAAGVAFAIAVIALQAVLLTRDPDLTASMAGTATRRA